MKSWLSIVLVFFGFIVGAISIYNASLAGVMGKMGLVGGDFQQEINKKELLFKFDNLEDYNCGIKEGVRNIPKYLFLRGFERVEFLSELGNNRIVCGLAHIKEGNMERGIYTIVKGLLYYKNYYSLIHEVISKDFKYCSSIVLPKYEGLVEEYLRVTMGRAHDVIYEVYKEVEQNRSRVDELCID